MQQQLLASRCYTGGTSSGRVQQGIFNRVSRSRELPLPIAAASAATSRAGPSLQLARPFHALARRRVAARSQALSTRSQPVVSSKSLLLRGLPFAVSDDDVRAFFEGFNVVQLVICRRFDGSGTGEAYVQLQTAEEAATARLKLNRQSVGNRYVEIYPVADELVSDVSGVEAAAPGHVVWCNGLPWKATKEEIVSFFDGVDIVGGVEGVFICGGKGERRGQAYVELASEQAMQLALAKHKAHMGERYVLVLPSSKAERARAMRRMADLAKARAGGRLRGPQLDGPIL